MDANKKLTSTMFWLLMLKSIRVRYHRTIVAMFCITIGAAVVTALSCVYLDISEKMKKELRTFGPNIVVTPNDQLNLVTIDENMVEMLKEKVPENLYHGGTPFLYGVVSLETGSAVMAGIDFPGLRKISAYWQLNGNWITVGFDDRNCMIGIRLAKVMELEIGDDIIVKSAKTGLKKTLTVKSILESGDVADDQIFVNLDVAQELLQMKQKVHQIKLGFTGNFDEIETAVKNLNQEFTQLSVHPIRKLSQNEGRIIHKIKGLMAFVTFIILIIVTVSVMITLISIVVERSTEIGLMKALGASNRDITYQVVGETLIITTFGITMGLGIGYLIAEAIVLSVFSASVNFRLAVIPITIVISLVIAVITSVLPVRMINKILPARVLRND